jgi:hypothetical protein
MSPLMRNLLVASAVLAASGVIVLIVGESVATNAAGIALLGVASVLLTSLVFLGVGRSEDEARRAGRH